MARRRKVISLDKVAKREHVRQRYAGRLVRLYHEGPHFAGYWTGEIPSVNDLTLDIHRTHRRAPTVQVKTFKKAVFKWLSRFAPNMPRYKYFDLDIGVWVPMFHEGGNVIMRDVSNFIKVSEDSICQSLGKDDRFNLDVAIHKRNLPQGQEPHWTFVLTGRNEEEHANERSINSITWKRAAESGAGYCPDAPAEDRDKAAKAEARRSKKERGQARKKAKEEKHQAGYA